MRISAVNVESGFVVTDDDTVLPIYALIDSGGAQVSTGDNPVFALVSLSDDQMVMVDLACWGVHTLH